MRGAPNERLRERVRWRVALTRVALGLGLGLGWILLGSAAEDELEGDPFRGRTLFVEKRCVQCHAVWGHGGTLGPEIVRIVAHKSLPTLAGAFWNHTPRMIEAMIARGYTWPIIERSEMADILSYLYYLRLFDDPGDPNRGKAYYTSFRCEFCHAVGELGGDVGPALDRFSAYGSSVPLAQAMWNAGREMRESQKSTGTPIPAFAGDEMVDIQAFIRELGQRESGDRTELLLLPDPARGEKIFRTKGCATCHAAGRSGAPDLAESALRMSAGQISGVLWNHSYAMQDRMRGAGIPFPRFEEQEMSDVISYLHFIGYRGREGSATRGAAVFRDKGCAVCHEHQQIRAPDLVDLHSSDDAIGLSAAMWNHAPEMHEQMAEHGVPWPKFETGEMEDLVSYLREAQDKDKE